MNRYATACQRRPRTQRLRSRAQEKRKHRKRENYLKNWFRKAGAESRQELMAREPESILKVWQTMTSTALFG
jgi:hypothetical protein